VAVLKIPPDSLRSGFVWTFAGNGVYAAGQWAILSLIAKLGDSRMLGHYALALAVVTPVVMLAHLNLRAVLATDVERRYPLGDYLAVRFFTVVVGLAAVAVLAGTAGESRQVTLVILLSGFAQLAETVSDIYYGALQRRERMGRIARSMMARAVVSVAALGVVLWLTRDLVAASAALVLARLVVLLVYDRPRGSQGESLARTGSRPQWTILRTALPLGVVLMLVSLNTNLPRYAIERSLGAPGLGVFAAVASFAAVGATVMNALGQVATPRLARYFSQGERARFRRLVLQLAGLAVALGAAGVLAAMLLGAFVLRLVYRPEYAAHSALLVAVMAAAVPGYIAIALGYVITSVRAFAAQVPLFCAVAASCAVASWLLVPHFGLAGAALALAAASGVQIVGDLWILARARRRAEAAA
jgi:O-antigen/teichoic acid export membrane protein